MNFSSADLLHATEEKCETDCTNILQAGTDNLAAITPSGEFFWSAYLKPGSGPGIKNGFWFNFGGGWCHLANDDLSQMLTGAAPRLYYNSVAGEWNLVIEATLFVTYTVVPVWIGTKAGGNDPIGEYTRQSGCDPLASLTIAGG